MKEIKLMVNNQEVPLNPTMSKVLNNMIIGFINVLKGIPEKKNHIKIELSL